MHRIGGRGGVVLGPSRLRATGSVVRRVVAGTGDVVLGPAELAGAGELEINGRAAVVMAEAILAGVGKRGDPPFWAAEEEWLLGLTDEIDALARM